MLTCPRPAVANGDLMQMGAFASVDKSRSHLLAGPGSHRPHCFAFSDMINSAYDDEGPYDWGPSK